MSCIYQRVWHTTVRFVDDTLEVETTYCGTDKELCAKMEVDPNTFEVRQAWWEIYRAPGFNRPEITKIKALQGMKAYFGCGEDLNRALNPLNMPEARGLFAEGVRGVVQSETFLWKRRGYSSYKEYEDFWYELYDNECRYYSNTDRVTGSWYDHVGYPVRSGVLFNRFKSQALYLAGDRYRLNGHFVDSFHSVALEMELEKEKGTVLKAGGEILRAPDPVCKEASTFMKELEQRELPGLGKKDIATYLGAENGCVHLIDLAADGAKTFTNFKRENTICRNPAAEDSD